MQRPGTSGCTIRLDGVPSSGTKERICGDCGARLLKLPTVSKYLKVFMTSTESHRNGTRRVLAGWRTTPGLGWIPEGSCLAEWMEHYLFQITPSLLESLIAWLIFFLSH